MARPRSSRQEKTRIGAALVFLLLPLWASLAQAQQPDQGNGNAPNQQPLLRDKLDEILTLIVARQAAPTCRVCWGALPTQCTDQPTARQDGLKAPLTMNRGGVAS